MRITIMDIPALANMTAEQHWALSGYWANEVAIADVAKELKIPASMVRAYYGVRDIMFFETEQYWCKLDCEIVGN